MKLAGDLVKRLKLPLLSIVSRAPDASEKATPDARVAPFTSVTVKLSPSGSLSAPLPLLANTLPETEPVSSIAKASAWPSGPPSFTGVTVRLKSELDGAELSSFPSSTPTLKLALEVSEPSCWNVTSPACSWVPVKLL